ncbi:uridine phosphorylase [Alkalihalophilus pseudofirmus]|uniref:nucleoside phosphorylase n=1 Tax=Alkalihalophilus pseudofirmus TaxID=79885 RepID=UPI00259B66D1|nr:uridine phosphorylase [Alkalihalophilus pseudofirmus]WEG17798.1 uridine phosphorylase [Alkalihalophilus pseudofirmus]
MKLYGEFSQVDWLNALQISKADVPSSFIIHGEWEHEENITQWRDILKEEMQLPKWNSVMGRHKGAQVGFANVYGAPMAANIVHQFAASGTEVFIQTGYFGGLSSEVKYGDIFIVTEAVMGDGVSTSYLPGQITVKSDPELVALAVKYCENKGYSYTTGSIYSTNTLLLETKDLIKAWASKGCIGVDMETAVTIAAAQYFNKRAVGLLTLSDHLINGDTLYTYTEDREAVEVLTDERVREVALYLAAGE